jgi:hypothetical protein
MDDEQDVFEFEKKFSFSFSKSWQGFKTALMGTLFVMANDSDLSFGMNVLGMIIDFVQMLAFPFNENTAYPWNPELTDWLIFVTQTAQLEFYVSKTDPVQNLSIYIVFIGIVFINLIVIGTVAYKFIKKKAQNVFLLKILRSVTSLLTTIFFMPILSFFMVILSCGLDISSDPLGCPTSQSTLLIVSSILFSILFGMVSLLVAASFYELDYKSDDASARPHARVELVYLLGQGALTVIFKVWEDPIYHYVQLFGILGVGAVSTVFHVILLPFYNYKVSVIQAQFISVFTWSGVCLAVSLVQDNTENPTSAILFYVGSPCIWILIGQTCDWRRSKLVEATIDTVRNPYEVELHTRFMILDRAGTYKTEEESLLNDAEDFYYQAERKFPDSSLLKIFVAQFHLTYRDRQEAIPKLEQAEKRFPALDEQFIIYKTRQNVGKDVITMVTFKSYLESSSKAEILALNYQLEFWKALTSESTGNDEKLVDLSKTITKNIDKAFNNYKFMLSVDRTHKTMVPMYVYFMEDVLHRKDGKVKNLKNRLRDMVETHNATKQTITSIQGSQPRISISFDKNYFGMIDKVNSEMMAWIKMPKAKIMNQRISSLMPYYFGISFINHLNKIKEKWEDTFGPPPVEMYFEDGEGFIIGCTCNFILDTDENNKLEARSIQYSMKTDSHQESLTKSLSPAISKSHESWHKPVNCVLMPHDESEVVIFISSDYVIMNFNVKASAFFGMNTETIGNKRIKDFISNFEDLFEKAKKHIGMNSGMLVEFSPVQTFLMSKSGNFSRIRISINSYCTDNNIYYILIISEPGLYSKPTQRFFSLFTKFLEVYIKKEGDITKILSGDLDDSNNNDSSYKIDRLLNKVRREVEAKNNIKSPELVSLSRLMWIFMICMMGVFGGSYAVSVMSFENYISIINQINTLTDIKVQSSLICTYLIMLDMSRQGFEIPDNQTAIIQTLSYVALNTKQKINDLFQNTITNNFNQNSLPCVEFKFGGGYEIVDLNLVEALLQQTTYALKLTKENIDNFNIINNTYAFWAYFNGKGAIKNSLNNLCNDFINNAENSRQTIEQWAYTFASIEIGLIGIVILASIPLILKSEELNMKIIRVFYTLPRSVLIYLQDITKINLEMRRDKHYPENRNRYQSAEDLWEDFLGSNQKNRKQSVSEQEKLAYDVTFWKKLVAFYKNSFTKRLIIYCILSAIVSWVLQTYVGVIIPTIKLDSAASIISTAGSIEGYQSDVTSSLIAEILFPLQQDLDDINQDISASLGNQSYFQYPSLETSYSDVMQSCLKLKIYFSMLLQGNLSLGITFDSIHSLQVSQFLTQFFPSNCPSYIDNCSYYGGVLSHGYYYTLHISIFDSEDLAYIIYANRNLTVEERMNSVMSILSPLLKLQHNYVNITSYSIEQEIISHFTNLVIYYNFIQEMVLIFYYLFCFGYMVLVFRRTLNIHEHKKKMTRCMLLLLPHRVVEFSKKIQVALENMNYD